MYVDAYVEMTVEEFNEFLKTAWYSGGQMEEPFFYHGISPEAYMEESIYLNKNLKEFYEGNYLPLWKQLGEKRTKVKIVD